MKFLKEQSYQLNRTPQNLESGFETLMLTNSRFVHCFQALNKVRGLVDLGPVA